MVEYTNLEYLAADLLTYMPFILLFLYSFKGNYRYNKYITVFILLLLSLLYFTCNILTNHYNDRIIHISTYVMTASCVLAALISIKANLGRIVFMALLLKNCADYVVVTAKFIEYLIWPEKALEIFNWTYAFSIAIFEIFFVSVLFLIIKKHFVLDAVGEFYTKSWRYLWVVPLFFYYTWISIFYSSETSSLLSALQIGNVVLLSLSIACQLLIYICLAKFVNYANDKTKLKEQLHFLELQTLQNRNIEMQLEQSSHMRHDLRHHALTLKAFAEEKKYCELKNYLDDYIHTIDTITTENYCSNKILNTLLSYYDGECRNNNIRFDVKLNIPNEMPLADTDISIIFGNLLENAYEACQRQAYDESRYILIRSKLIHNNLAFSIQNSVSSELEFNDFEVIPSSKRFGNGIGTKSCKYIVSKFGGNLSFNCKDGVFYVELIIPMS